MVYKITLKGVTYTVEVKDGQAELLSEEVVAVAAPVAAAPAAPAPEAAPAAPAAVVITGSGEAVNAPMPGTILKVNVTQGQAVKEGDVLCVLEAMKMENDIKAPKSGTSTQVLISKSASVDTGAPLVIIG